MLLPSVFKPEEWIAQNSIEMAKDLNRDSQIALIKLGGKLGNKELIYCASHDDVHHAFLPAVMAGHLDLMKDLYNRHRSEENIVSLVWAARGGSRSMIEFLFAHGVTSFILDAMILAAQYGHADVLLCLHYKLRKVCDINNWTQTANPAVIIGKCCSPDVWKTAFKNNHIRMLHRLSHCCKEFELEVMLDLAAQHDKLNFFVFYKHPNNLPNCYKRFQKKAGPGVTEWLQNGKCDNCDIEHEDEK